MNEEDQPAPKRRLSSTVVKMEAGEILEDDAASSKGDEGNKNSSVEVTGLAGNSENQNDRNVSNWARRDSCAATGNHTYSVKMIIADVTGSVMLTWFGPDADSLVLQPITDVLSYLLDPNARKPCPHHPCQLKAHQTEGFTRHRNIVC